MSLQHKRRYRLREELDGTWTIYDIFTGMPAEVFKMLASGLVRPAADDMMSLMNRVYSERR